MARFAGLVPKASLRKVGAVVGKQCTVSSALHGLKAPTPISVTDAGIVISVNALQLINADEPMDVRPDRSVTEGIFSHPLNAPAGMTVTPEGMVIAEAISLHRSNAFSPIEVNPAGNVREVRL